MGTMIAAMKGGPGEKTKRETDEERRKREDEEAAAVKGDMVTSRPSKNSSRRSEAIGR